MRGITKIALFIIALIGLGQSLLVAAYLWPLPPVDSWLDIYWPTSRWVMLGMSAVVFATFVVLLLLALFRRSTVSDLVIQNQQGQLKLSRQAIESSVAKAIVTEYPVRHADVAVKLTRDNVAHATVSASLADETGMADLGKAIEDTVKQRLHNLLGVEVKKVTVKILPQRQLNRTARVL